ncbi:hypothetical protein HA466_0256790 [Hirschfeldia incana]|nr:hypothetical protein HA466_0256790 [Hirschfeldia incana]
MGRDWSWLRGGKKKSSSKSKKDFKATPPSSSPTENTATATVGCMSAVFNIFDLQHVQFPINHPHLHLPKDAEETPFSPTRKDGNLNISMGIKIKTKPQARSSSSSSLAATESYSPSVKTPTLVARLMGLDLIPDNYTSSPTPTPSSSSSSSHTNKHRHYSLQRNSVDGGTRSLPETPRISLGRRSVDVISHQQHQRSSLHLREMKIHAEDKENQSPRDYARKIVMQLKENVSRRRRMGTDITNREQQAREAHEPKIMKVREESRLRTVKTELQETEQDEKQSKSAAKRKKAENFESRLVKPPHKKQEELFVRSPVLTSNSINIKKKGSSRNRALSEFLRRSQTHIAAAPMQLPLAERLVLRDFLETVVTQSELLTFEGEREGVVMELERGIFEALVSETVAFKRGDDVSGTWGVHVT